MADPQSVTYYGEAGGIVSSVRVEVRGGHAHILVWNRGGYAGTVVVNEPDAQAYVARLLPADVMRGSHGDDRG